MMKAFGFTASQTRIYLALLTYGPMSGYEVSKRSGVARSKVYNELEKLVTSNIVLVNKSEPKLYSAIEGEELVDLLTTQTMNKIHHIQESLQQVTTAPQDSDLLWQLDTMDQVEQKIHYMIEHAQEELFIQIWDTTLTPKIMNALTKAEGRISSFICILFSESKDYSLPFDRFYPHGFEEDKLKDMKGKWINLVCDDGVLFGTLGEVCDVIWTHNVAMGRLAREYIKHDAYTLKVIGENRTTFDDLYGTELKTIRDIY